MCIGYLVFHEYSTSKKYHAIPVLPCCVLIADLGKVIRILTHQVRFDFRLLQLMRRRAWLVRATAPTGTSSRGMARLLRQVMVVLIFAFLQAHTYETLKQLVVPSKDGNSRFTHLYKLRSVALLTAQ